MINVLNRGLNFCILTIMIDIILVDKENYLPRLFIVDPNYPNHPNHPNYTNYPNHLGLCQTLSDKLFSLWKHAIAHSF